MISVANETTGTRPGARACASCHRAGINVIDGHVIWHPVAHAAGIQPSDLGQLAA